LKIATVVIKKYGNRRLYDTSASRYVNLDDISAMVRNGTDVKVVDAGTGEDLTRLTLSQIIMEEAKDHPSGLPLELLKELVMATDHIRQEFMMWYMKSAFDGYQKLQGAVQSGLSQVGSAVFSPLDTVKNFLTPTTAKPPSQSDELEALREKIAELQSLLEQRRVSKRKPATRRRVVAKEGPKNPA
jgi:polyhydroxyalkanoate synthesis repressor PhaR